MCVCVHTHGCVFEYVLEMAVGRKFSVPSQRLLKIQAGEDISMLTLMKFTC